MYLRQAQVLQTRSFARPLNFPSQWRALAFLAAHIPLAIVLYKAPQLATLHALLTLGLGCWIALLGRKVIWTVWMVGYVVGAEVLWRMTEAEVPWEFGKYALVLLLGIAVVRFLRKGGISVVPLLYLTLLLPSCLLTFSELGLSEAARQEISFNLSGPLALALSALFFSRMSFSPSQLRTIVWVLSAPIIGIAALALYGINTAESLVFTTESNFATSGGFGPNQVSSILGLGAALLLFLALQESNKHLRWVEGGLASWLLIQGAVTFSRGGVASFFVFTGLAGVHFLRSARSRSVFLAALLIAVLGGYYLVLPFLNDLTEGRFEQRFSDFDTTHRSEFMSDELGVWWEHPFLGVGPGMAKNARSMIGMAAHTEFTRLLAEHGVAGLLAIVSLLLMLWHAYRRAPSLLGKALVAALAGWSLSEMGHAGMRIVAISFIFGLAMSYWHASDSVPSVKRRSGYATAYPFGR